MKSLRCLRRLPSSSASPSANRSPCPAGTQRRSALLDLAFRPIHQRSAAPALLIPRASRPMPGWNGAAVHRQSGGLREKESHDMPGPAPRRRGRSCCRNPAPCGSGKTLKSAVTSQYASGVRAATMRAARPAPAPAREQPARHGDRRWSPDRARAARRDHGTSKAVTWLAIEQ